MPSCHNIITPHSYNPSSFQGLSGKVGEDEAGLVDLGVVVSAKLDLFLRGPLAQGNADVGIGVLAADHEADLSGWVGRDGRVGVLGHREDLFAVLLEVGNQGEVKPLVLSCAFVVVS